MKLHFPDIAVYSDADTTRLFPKLLDGTTWLGPFRPLPGRWAWVLVQVLQLVSLTKWAQTAASSLVTGQEDAIASLVGPGNVWFLEPDVGWAGPLFARNCSTHNQHW